MNGCQLRHSLRCCATSGRSCSAALSDFFVRQAKAAQRRPDRGQRACLDPALAEPALQFGERDARLGLGQLAQHRLMSCQQGLAIAADPGRGRAACLAHPSHQLDGGRGAHLEAAGCLAGRTARLDRPDQPPTQVLGQGCRHHDLAALPATSNQNP